jgi:hypothetical protein
LTDDEDEDDADADDVGMLLMLLLLVVTDVLLGLAQICTLALSSIEHIPPSLHLNSPTMGVECKEARESTILLSAQSNSNSWPSLVPHQTNLLSGL